MKRFIIIGFTIAGAILGSSTEINKRQQICNQGLSQLPGINEVCKAWQTPGAARDGAFLGAIIGFGLGTIPIALFSKKEFDPQLATWLGVAAMGANAILVTPAPQSAVATNQPAFTTTASSVKDPQVRAFLDVIAYAEGTGDRYDIKFGFIPFKDFSKHPDVCLDFFNPATQRNDCTTAAGRYQFITTTFEEFKQPDFSPESQDRAAIALLNKIGALQLLKQGDFEGAVRRAGEHWASLPGSTSQQPQKQMPELKQVYEQALKKYGH